MTYSLVSMPVVGFDLTRIQGGDEVAGLLLTALGVRAEHLPALAAAHPGVAHARRLADVRAAVAAASDEVPLAQVADRIAGLGLSTAVVRSLETGTLGDLDALVRLVRHDVLDWTWVRDGSVAVQDPHGTAAADVLAGALAAAYHRAALPADLRAALRMPLDAAGFVADDPDLGPQGDRVRAVLDAVRDLTPEQRRSLREGVATGRGRQPWATAVHDASWAVYLTGRIRSAAAAQLLAVRAFVAAGLTPRDSAYGVWNAVSGLVQCTVVDDLLDGEARDVLRDAAPGLVAAADI